MRLGINVDHVATLRQARRGTLPDPVWAARAAQWAGCDSIVCHLREDRRHIQDADLIRLKKELKVPLNLEMGAHPEIVRIACRVRPYQATLVPERRQELTTEGGLDLSRPSRRLSGAIERLRSAGIRVSLFIDPDAASVKASARLGVPMVELHTGRYAEGGAGELQRLRRAARWAREMGLIVAAGHGLDDRNVQAVARIPEIEELNIGFSIVARSIETGFEKAVREMVQAIRGAKR
ncbi:MAG: pyridoxine 5'-phosphate synthase [Candidatus Omnitrophica bacterium]|nr:pyridoxine 5'-phosphate synthase [Candidatus Omnitrophota bacterium]